MAFTRKNKAVVETNHVSAVRTGNIKAQYPAAANMENGMALVVDDENKSIALAGATSEVLYLHASEEQLYEDHLGRNAFSIAEGEYPRALKLEVGDIFETNALAQGAEITYAAKDLLVPVAGVWTKAIKDQSAKAVIVELVTLPNGEAGAKIAIIKPVTVE